MPNSKYGRSPESSRWSDSTIRGRDTVDVSVEVCHTSAHHALTTYPVVAAKPPP